MKYVYQFGIIAGVTFAGEILKSFINLPIPASVWGLVLLLLLLMTKRIKPEQVKDAAGFLIQIMPILFVPATVGMMVAWERLKNIFLPVMVIIAVSTLLVMVVSGKVADFLLKRGHTDE